MILPGGSRLGPYEILSALGAGGMGEVYKARDTRLDRTVAIKILPDGLAADPQFQERFEREAKAIAQLSHPNICAIHDVGRRDATQYLVLEYLEGETLESRLKKGALPLDQALAIAVQIAGALDSAHRAGIVHRDLKPANVFLTKGGAKLLDFGLAKTSAAVGTSPGFSMLPTTPPNLTAQGTILGTFQYMAPEQLEGEEADARTDVFAFGAVLFEMITGRKAFEGKSQASLIGAIMHADPPAMASLQPLTPRSVEHIVKTCLAKDPDDRWQAARDMLHELKWIESTIAEADIEPATARSSLRRVPVIVSVLTAFVAVAIGAAGSWFLRSPPVGEAVAFTVETPAPLYPDSFAVSPDGRQLAFTGADKDGEQKLWVRALGTTTARVLPGTERAVEPFWSPDSRHIAFFTDAELKRIDLASGVSQTICKTTTTTGRALGGSWNDRNLVLFARTSTGISSVPAAGGEPQKVTTLTPGAGELIHGFPTWLPDQRHFVYLKGMAPTETSQLMWRALDSGEERVVRRLFSRAFYAPTGHLVFRLNGPLVAQAFDPSRGVMTGDPVQLAPAIYTELAAAAVALSPAGRLAYRAGQGSAGFALQLTWVDRKGAVLGQVGSPGDHRNLSLDPPSERVVTNPIPPSDVWLIDSRRGRSSRLTFDPATDSDAIFSPEGRWVAFYSNRQPPGIYRRASNGVGGEELIAATGLQSLPRDWSPDGRFLLFDKGLASAQSLWLLPLDGDRKPVPYLERGRHGHFSPDSHWVAYASDEGGSEEVFVQDVPRTGAKFQISTAGGSEPRWRRDGHELFYLAPDGRIMSVELEIKPEFRSGVPKPLFQTRLMTVPDMYRRYGVSADGLRFILNVPVSDQAPLPITVVLNWPALLKK